MQTIEFMTASQLPMYMGARDFPVPPAPVADEEESQTEEKGDETAPSE